MKIVDQNALKKKKEKQRKWKKPQHSRQQHFQAFLWATQKQRGWGGETIY